MTSILLVDDDPLQASLILSVLEQRFGDVRRVTDAAEALCLIEQREFADNLRLVISGHHRPGVGGPTLVNEPVSYTHLEVKCIFGRRCETAYDLHGSQCCSWQYGHWIHLQNVASFTILGRLLVEKPGRIASGATFGSQATFSERKCSRSTISSIRLIFAIHV